jgi:TolA-binding protein
VRAAPAEETRATASAPRGEAPGAGEELALLDRAYRAVKSDARAALELASEHARRFPASALVQEREAIAIEALGALGRGEEARARAAAFLERYPGSALRRRVERSVR